MREHIAWTRSSESLEPPARGERLLASCTLCECVSRRSEAAQRREAVVLRRRTSLARAPIAREAEWSRGTVCEYV